MRPASMASRATTRSSARKASGPSEGRPPHPSATRGKRPVSRSTGGHRTYRPELHERNRTGRTHLLDPAPPPDRQGLTRPCRRPPSRLTASNRALVATLLMGLVFGGLPGVLAASSAGLQPAVARLGLPRGQRWRRPRPRSAARPARVAVRQVTPVRNRAGRSGGNRDRRRGARRLWSGGRVRSRPPGVEDQSSGGGATRIARRVQGPRFSSVAAPPPDRSALRARPAATRRRRRSRRASG